MKYSSNSSLAIALMLLINAAASANQIICRGFNNQEVLGFFQNECQTDQIVYRLCTNSTSSSADGAAFLMLHILVPRDDHVTVAVTNRDGRVLQFQHWIRQQQQQDGGLNCSMEFDVLHVKIEDSQGIGLNNKDRITRVETHRSVRYYSLFSEETQIASDRVISYTMVVGYILEMSAHSTETTGTSGKYPTDTIVGFAAIVSRPKRNSDAFGDSTLVEVLNDSHNGNILYIKQETNNCSKNWCFFDVKNSANCENWSSVIKSPKVYFNFQPRLHRGVILRVIKFAPLNESKSTSRGQVISMPYNCLHRDPEPGVQFVPTTNVIAVMISLIAILMLITGLLYQTNRRYRRPVGSTASSVILVVCSTANQLRQLIDDPKIAEAVQRFNDYGLRVIFEKSLDIKQLRVSLAQTKVFILLGDDFNAHGAASRRNCADNLDLLTVAEKSKYTAVKEENLAAQLTNYLHDLVTQRDLQRKRRHCELTTIADPEFAALVGDQILNV